MTTITAHFDGRVFVPEGEIQLPVGTPVEIAIEDDSPFADILGELDELNAQYPPDPDTPRDLAAQHDFYLHGLPKRPENDIR